MAEGTPGEAGGEEEREEEGEEEHWWLWRGRKGEGEGRRQINFIQKNLFDGVMMLLTSLPSPTSSLTLLCSLLPLPPHSLLIPLIHLLLSLSMERKYDNPSLPIPSTFLFPLCRLYVFVYVLISPIFHLHLTYVSDCHLLSPHPLPLTFSYSDWNCRTQVPQTMKATLPSTMLQDKDKLIKLLISFAQVSSSLPFSHFSSSSTHSPLLLLPFSFPSPLLFLSFSTSSLPLLFLSPSSPPLPLLLLLLLFFFSSSLLLFLQLHRRRRESNKCNWPNPTPSSCS